MYGGEFALVEVQIKHAAIFAGVLQAKDSQCIVLLCCDGLAACKHFDEQIWRSTLVGSNVAAQLFAGIQQLLTGGRLEVPLLSVFYYMIGGISTGSLFLCTLCGSF